MTKGDKAMTKNKKQIALIADEPELIKNIQSQLKKAGFAGHHAQDLNETLDLLNQRNYHLLLMDMNIQEESSREMLNMLCQQQEPVPVMLLSSLEDMEKKLPNFNLSLCDYIAHPINPVELIARIKILLKRVPVDSGRELSTQIKAGPFEINLLSGEAKKDGQLMELRPKLLRLLTHFLRNPGRVVSREDLHKLFWDPLKPMNENSLSVHVHALRNLVEDDPNKPVYLKTIRGMGYRWDQPEEK